MKREQAKKIANIIKLSEGLEKHDLKRLVSNVISIDAFSSKMGDDADVCVVGFVVKDKDPGLDLVNFIEKGYSFVLDADCTPGENSNGEYYVFVELERSIALPEQIIEMISDVVRLTDIETEEWKFTYYKNNKEIPLSDKNLRKYVILTSDEYNKTVKLEKDQEEAELDALRNIAGVKKSDKQPKDKDIEALQSAAGII